jgi:hypothetical protein
MATNKHPLLRPRAFAAGFAACAALGATAPAASADLNLFSTDSGVTLYGTDAPEQVELLHDPQHPTHLIVAANVAISSGQCEQEMFDGKSVRRCTDPGIAEIDLGGGADGVDVHGQVPIKWLGGPGEDVVDVAASTGAHRIGASSDFGADEYRLSPKTTLSYEYRDTPVQIDHSKIGNDGEIGGGENDRIFVAHGARYVLTKLDDVYFGVIDAIADNVEGGKGDDYLYGGAGTNALRGGEGDDNLDGAGSLDGGSGNDAFSLSGNDAFTRTLAGGAGIDSVLAGGDQAGGMVVRLDGIANDGYTEGELTANVGKDIENVDTTGNGLSVADTIVGSGAENTIVTGGGPDTVNPGGGADSVESGDGIDKIASVDGAVDAINCGPAFDTLSADKVDTRQSCETIELGLDSNPPVDEPPVVQPPAEQPLGGQPPVVQPPVVQPPATDSSAARLTVKAKVAKQKLRTLRRTKRLQVRVKVSRAARVRVKVTARRGAKTIRLGKRTPRIAANRWTTVKVKLSQKQLRKLRKGVRVKVAFKASAGDVRASLARSVRVR